jgi:hypothetical protein
MASSKTKRLEKIAPWGTLGVIVTVVGIVISIVIFYWQENSGKARASWQIRNEEKLVEVRETIKDLRILYQGQDILESGQELRILTLEFVNNGRNITQDMFDQNLDFGLRFPHSEIITSQVVKVSSKYLNENLKPEIKVLTLKNVSTSSNETTKALILPKLIFDRQSAFTLKVYLLNSSRGEPSQIISLGKIAGLDGVPVISAPPIQESTSNQWFAIFAGLLSCLLGVATYAFGLRVKAKAIDRNYILEALRQELRDVSKHSDPSSKPTNPTELLPPQ